MSHRPLRVSVALAGVALAAVVLSPATTVLTARATLEVVARGLVNPRGLAFGPDGALYVAEAGSGGPTPCFTNGNGQSVCYGATGAVTRIELGDTPTWARVVEDLPSVAPASGAGATGPHDVSFQGLGNGFVTIGLGTDPENRTEDGNFPAFASVGDQFGRLVRFQPNGKWAFAEDLAEFELETNPDGNVPDSNPYGLLALPNRRVYTDAGGNSLNQVRANGRITTLAVFDDRTIGTNTMQAVPTSVAVGPDGAFYVGQLTGFPFPQFQANVYRVPANGGEPTIFATGFTKIIDLAFHPDGSLYVLQLSTSAGAPPQAGAGALMRVAPNGTTTTVVAAGAGLVAPGGIAITDDGTIYVTNLSVQPDRAGTVVKITE